VERYNNRLRFALKVQGESMCPIGSVSDREMSCPIGNVRNWDDPVDKFL